MFCAKCGAEMSDNALSCPKCGEPTKNAVTQNAGKSRNVYGILAFFLGGLGVHNFYAGRWLMAIFEILMTCVLIPVISGVVVGATGDADSVLVVQVIGYGFVFILIITEMLTVKKDGKGVPFAGCENK